MIRDGVMCQPDPTIPSMVWGIHGPLPIGNFGIDEKYRLGVME